MSVDAGIAAWRRERNSALLRLDIGWARASIEAGGLKPPDDETLLLSLHKVRYDCADLPDALRLESGEWLRARGYGAMQGRDLEWPGVLPR